MRLQLCINPVVKQRADPWIYQHIDGYYYFTASVPQFDRIELRKTQCLKDLAQSKTKVIWKKHESGPMSANIWAPEIHYIDGKWYMYFAAADRPEPVNGLFNHRIYVLENTEREPLCGQWVERGQIKTNWESFALDATTFQHDGNRYLVWAQKDNQIAGNSNLYIALMANPWTINGSQVLLSKPEFPWEIQGYLVNEGPAVIIKNDKIFITYSGSATDQRYCMGLLTANLKDDLLEPSSWKKSKEPIFISSEENGQYGPGHNCFTKSEDGTTDLLVYHARNYQDIVGDPLHDPNRHTRIQALSWSHEGIPNFGIPVRDGPLFVDFGLV